MSRKRQATSPQLPQQIPVRPLLRHAKPCVEHALTFSGAGPIGLVTLLAAHAAGCTPIAITDLVASRLEFAKTLVPTVRTILLERADSPERNSEKIKAELGLQPRVALECTGFESSIRAAIYVSSLGERLRWLGA